MRLRNRRVFACVLCALLLFASLFSIFFIAAEANHDCVGEDCPICAVLAEAEETLDKLGTANPPSISFSAPAFLCLLLLLPAAGHVAARKSPVAEKVRMNN